MTSSPTWTNVNYFGRFCPNAYWNFGPICLNFTGFRRDWSYDMWVWLDWHDLNSLSLHLGWFNTKIHGLLYRQANDLNHTYIIFLVIYRISCFPSIPFYSLDPPNTQSILMYICIMANMGIFAYYMYAENMCILIYNNIYIYLMSKHACWQCFVFLDVSCLLICFVSVWYFEDTCSELLRFMASRTPESGVQTTPAALPVTRCQH